MATTDRLSARRDRAPSSWAAAPRVPFPPTRLSLTPADSRRGPLDGCRGPHSRDLSLELISLTAVLDGRWGRITRVSVNPAFWPVIPGKVPVSGHTVGVGWFAAEQGAHKFDPALLQRGPPGSAGGYPTDCPRLCRPAADRRLQPAQCPYGSDLIAEEKAEAVRGGRTPTAPEKADWELEDGPTSPSRLWDAAPRTSPPDKEMRTMDTLITVVVILAVIVFGVVVIRVLNGQPAERVAAFRYGRFRQDPRGRSNWSEKSDPPSDSFAGSSGVASHRDHRDAGHRQLRPRRRPAHGRGVTE
jgi:hypothetical protein